MGGLILGFDGNTAFIPKCGYKKKDGSIIICQECVSKIKVLQALLKYSEEIEKEINRWLKDDLEFQMDTINDGNAYAISLVEFKQAKDKLLSKIKGEEEK